jgi:octopine/nopaline transport system substrate-binding protein
MIAGLNAGKYDVIMDAIVITPERKQVVSFTIPYAATPASFIAVRHVAAAGDGANHTIKLNDDDKSDSGSDCAIKSGPERQNDWYRFRHRLYPVYRQVL